MRRVALLAALAVAVLLVWWAWGEAGGHGGSSSRVGVRREPARLGHGESLREVDEQEWREGQGASPRAEPAVLLGTVFDPNGRPVRRAEVSVLHPKPSWLVFSGPDGGYELEFERPGRYVVEAQLTIDLAPRRAVVDVPEQGNPPRLDFHLGPAGFVFGEVVIGNVPVFRGFVDIDTVDLFGDATSELDTDIDNGFFNFAWEPTRDVPLRLVVRCDEGFMKEPVRFRYTGERIDLGQIALTRFPAMRVRMRLPDGTWATSVDAYDAAAWTAARVARGAEPDLLGWDSYIRVPTREGGTVRLVLCAAGTDIRLVRSVDLVVDQLYELEVAVRPGPFGVRGRLVDERGVPLGARFRVGAGEGGTIVETGEDGWFAASVPHGGVFDAVVTAMAVDGFGWLPFQEGAEPRFVLDADDGAPCVLARDRRVLLVTAGEGRVVRLRCGGGRALDCSSPGAEARGHLLGPFDADGGVWTPGVARRLEVPHGARLTYPDFPAGGERPFRMAPRGWTVLDTR